MKSSALRSHSNVDQRSSADAKIACFRSLFRGRADVFPLRFESRKTGRAGYSPACANEWIRGVCEKPRVRCADCPNQSWIPVSEETVRWHLSGVNPEGAAFVMGIYPMLLDESCFFLAIDLDGEGWQEDARVLADQARKFNLPVVLERSRSGKGGHLWFFFEEAVPAASARRLGTFLLSEALDARPEVGLGSYDRLFPNQDTLPRGGFGNLIALPLQKAARDAGNSVFVNEQFLPHEDQWAFLSGIEPITTKLLEDIIESGRKRNRILPVRVALADEFALEPWKHRPSRKRNLAINRGDAPAKLSVVLADGIYIRKEGMPPALRNRIQHLAAFQNPEFYRAQAMRLPTFDKPRVISCAEDHPQHFALPRGCWEDLEKLGEEAGFALACEDQRHVGRPLSVRFEGELRPDQAKAANALKGHDTGVLAATTAFGKTVLAAWMIAQREVNTLVLVHRKQLMDQWVERLSTFLGIEAKEIGRLGGGRRKLRGSVDVALIQSLVRKQEIDDRIGDYGHIVVDECHHLPARSFELLLSRAKARYVLGLSATVQRKDGHHPIIFMQCGPVRHRVDAKGAAQARPFRHNVIVRPTGFRSLDPAEEDPRVEFQRLCRGLIEDDSRNSLICSDVRHAVEEGRNPLILTERTEHLERLAEGLTARGLAVMILRGGMGTKVLRSVMEELSEKKQSQKVVLATGRFVGEGFDCPKLDTLFVTLPVSWRGTIAQYVGRLHRLHEGKKEVRVYDYADLDESMLARMFDKRCAGYEAVGYTVLLPASALPGWPKEVPLPVDPKWKKDYAATVRCLIRDGIEPPLAEAFIGAVQAQESNRSGARSASEAFLFRRLETLETTRGRFSLNPSLPIPFDQRGKMEVDFLCRECRLVIELDGSQHLADEDAWRRDRQKDALLQRHGYFVLRVLASDLAKRLDSVLNEILATLTFLDRRESRQAADSLPEI